MADRRGIPTIPATVENLRLTRVIVRGDADRRPVWAVGLGFGLKDVANIAFLAARSLDRVRLEERGPGHWRIVVAALSVEAVRDALQNQSPLAMRLDVEADDG